MHRRLAIPAAIVKLEPSDEERLKDLLDRFNNARRRAYMLKQRDVSRTEVERLLQVQLGVNSRYAKDAYHSIENLPPHVAFGGLKLQRLRESGKITREEYKKRRNSLLISRGEKSKHGNLNTRIIKQDGKTVLRINTTPNEKSGECWIYPEIFIPEKYLRRYKEMLEGRHPYTVILKRREDDRGYDVRITVEVPKNREEEAEHKRVLALDINAGHLDFAVAEREHVVAVGRINWHEVQSASTNKAKNLLYETAKKVRRIAEHFGARIVYGRLSTRFFKGGRRANRKVRRIPHRKLGLILEHKCNAKRRSEAYTTKVGEKFSPLVGLDVHKCAASVFALKVIDYEAFKTLLSSSSSLDEDEIFLHGVTPDEGAGSLRRWLSVGSELTALHQPKGLLHGEVPTRDRGYPATPGSGGLSAFLGSLKTNLPCLHVKIC